LCADGRYPDLAVKPIFASISAACKEFSPAEYAEIAEKFVPCFCGLGVSAVKIAWSSLIF
jgi:hypothetical protein